MVTTVDQPTLRMVWTHATTEIDLAPLQGLWSEEQYLRLTDQTNHLLELTDGIIEVLPMPTDRHQVILACLYELFLAFLRPMRGKVLFAPLRVRIRLDKYREPDILLVRNAQDPRRQQRYWLGADLVVEIVSPDNPERDTITKRADYAEAGIPEYWIVNPATETITVLTLTDAAYTDHGTFQRGTMATSVVLAGFAVAVDAVFDAE